MTSMILDVVLLLSMCAIAVSVKTYTAEERLIRDLFNGYNKYVRPANQTSDVIYVNFGMALVQVINVDEKNQVMKTNVWERFWWQDYQLTWDPANYDGITIIRVAPAKVWLPDIVLLNNADGVYEVSFRSNVLIDNNGWINWVPPAIFKSSCTINVEYFPFDKQVCEMKFGSWTFNKDEVKLGDYNKEVTKVDLNDYVLSGTWDLSSAPRRIDNNGSGGSEYATMIFEIHLSRMTLFYTVNLVIPCVMIAMLAATVFYLPVDSGEKMTLAINLLLALVVFLLLVSSVLPPTSLTIPLVSKYLLFTLILNIITILMTAIIQNWHFRGPTTHSMPKWVKTIMIDTLPKVLCMRRPKDMQPQLNIDCYGFANVTNSCFDDMDGTELEPLDMHHPGCKHVVMQSASEPGSSDDDVVMTAEGLRAALAIEFIAEHLHLEDTVSDIKEDWQYAAMVLDRLLLFIFTTVTITGAISILTNAPGIFD
ncbi:PREDICTED: acetylcholine receptor subunit beta-like 1 [Priapulus caudatus]|uniref:Acetylcholine receptor subunit beta-like 1 n=1 Tax=Priapulus caudatus TaxID=37621 RepID=A0ABM1DRZ7_PRICU|nr:PREDICTED: acetylcholine receptor subunit beta-like 1 [Priapulus caudatus]